MSGSGSGIISMFDGNMSNDSFSCRTSELSSFNVTDRSFWQIDQSQRIGVNVVGAIVLLISVVGTIWNSFIIITFLVKHKLLKEPANIFLLNLAFADLLLCLTTMMYTYVTSFSVEFVFGSNDVTRCANCNMAGFFIFFLIFLSAHLLMVLSIDRFILLSRPLHYKRLMNWWKATLISILMYVICFVITILPIIGFGEYEFNPRFGSCTARFTPFSNLRFIFFGLLEFTIPCIIIAITNVGTYRLVSKFLHRNHRRRSTFHRPDSSETGEKAKEQKKHQRQQAQLVKVFGALLVVTIISYTPTMISILIFGALQDLPSVIYIIGHVSFLTSAVFHPIVESFFVKELRYQVNRAKKRVRSISTSVYRTTTSYFSNKTLDEAGKKADDKSLPTAKRPIKFLNGKVVMDSEGVDHSVVTEMESMASHDDLTTDANGTPETSKRVRASLTPEGGEFGGSEGKPMLGKTRRSVTFQDNIVPGPVVHSPATSPGATTSKSSLVNSEHHNGSPVIVTIPEITTEEVAEGEETPNKEAARDEDGKGSHDENTTL